MTAVADLLAHLRNLGVTLTVDPGPPERVSCRAPRGILTPDLVETIRERKEAIIAALRGGDADHAPPPRIAPEPCPACKGMRFWSLGNGHWVCGTCHPPAPGALERGVLWREGRPRPGEG